MYQQQQINHLPVICAQYGVQDVIVSPGSRSAPLTLAFYRYNKFNLRVVVDERSAAFIALGIAQQKRKPVVLICTSGTASLNYAPAIAEAYFQKIPLLVLTADRPPELVGNQDGQTIFQQEIYGRHVKASYQLPDTYTAHTKDHIHALKAALHNAVFPDAGPVHVNVPLREPLYTTDAFVFPDNKTSQLTFSLSAPDTTELLEALNFANSVLVACASLPAEENLRKKVNSLVQNKKIVWLNDVCANLRGMGDMSYYDVLLGTADDVIRQQLAPDVLITVGDNHVSKNLKLFLKKYSPKKHFHFTVSEKAPDTFATQPKHLRTDIHGLVALLQNVEFNNSNYHTLWEQHNQRATKALEQFTKSVDFGELKAVAILLKNLAKNTQVQLANSMSVRYMNYLSHSADYTFYCNRGTSGIDGSTSTAVGAALATDASVVLLTGDLSFFYDEHAFWNDFVPANLTVVVINNNGGGIFRLIDGPRQQPEREFLFTTPGNRSVKEVAEHYKLCYSSAANESELSKALQNTTSSRPRIIEVKTNPDSDVDLFTSFKNLSIL
jgi:2-succinyl-5-enolpyruvyl-6-hydroxy-3-cyclohexene-1-carboxylate synthase